MVRRVLFIFLALAGCKVDPAANTAPTCREEADCGEGQECYRGFCIPTSCDDGIRVECYSGDIITRDVGRCKAGMMECIDGRFGACIGEVLPLAEDICGNGIDDNCDDDTDEFDTECKTGLFGICQDGTRSVCNGPCVQDTMAMAETCNMLDDDCDSELDEEIAVACYPNGADGCTPRMDGTYDCVGACTAGVRRCVMGMMGECEGAVVPVAGPDECTPMGMLAADDDCDNMIDEDCVCILGSMQDCYSGKTGTEMNPPCQVGQQECVMTPEGPRFGPCEGEAVPGAEDCTNEGSDDDCDATPDDLPLRGLQCMDPTKMGICVDGTLECTNPMIADLTCVTTSSRAETCNMLDDDCDGTGDDGFDLSSDPANCGMCGFPCGNGTRCCAGTCTSTAVDVNHCGACGNGCALDEVCCGGDCDQTTTSTSNCGMCGRTCPVDQVCCGGDCVDTRLDESHCSGCGMDCDPGQLCCNSTCLTTTMCPLVCDPPCNTAAGQQCCDGVCVETTMNPDACGSCTTTCGTTEPLCCGSDCVADDEQHCGATCAPCGMNELCCQSSCVAIDEANCNDCNVVCGAGQTCCPDGCFNLQTNREHCDSCFRSCSGPEVCRAGECCRPEGSPCGSPSNCCPGSICFLGTCIL